MNITFLARNDDSSDLVASLKTGACHYVSLAVPGLTCASACVEYAGGFNLSQRNDFMMTINRAKETGTLYPKVNITLLPSPTASYGGTDSNTHNDGEYTDAEIVVQLRDALKANAEYIRNETLYFDFRYVCDSETRYIACLEAAIKQNGASCATKIVTTIDSKYAFA